MAENKNLKKENEDQRKEIEDLKKENIQVKTKLSMKTKEAEELAKMNIVNNMANIIKNNNNLKKRIREWKQQKRKLSYSLPEHRRSMLEITPTQ